MTLPPVPAAIAAPDPPGHGRTSRARTAGLGGRARMLYVGTFAMFFDRFAIAPMLLPIAHDLHAPLSAVAAAATGYFVMYGAMQVLYGLLSDRLGRVRLMRIACAGAALAGVTSAAAPDLLVLIAARAATGAMVCCLFPSSLAYIADTFPFRVRQRVVADLLAAVAVGTAVATLGAGLLAHFTSWRLGFLLPALVLLAMSCALRWLPESLPAPSTVRPLEQLRQVAGRPWVLFLFAVALPEGAAILGFLTFLPPALEANGVSPATAGVVVASYGIAALLGTRIVKQLATRVPPHLLIAMGGTCLLLCFVSAAIRQSVPHILAASVLAGLAYAIMHSTFHTWATEVAPDSRGTATALFGTGAFLGAGLGAAALAGLAGEERYTELFWIAAGVTAPTMALGAIGRRRFPDRAAAEAAPPREGTFCGALSAAGTGGPGPGSGT